MVKITILSYKSRKYATVFDWLIRLWTVSKYSHSEMIIGTSRYASIPNKGVCKINKNIGIMSRVLLAYFTISNIFYFYLNIDSILQYKYLSSYIVLALTGFISCSFGKPYTMYEARSVYGKEFWNSSLFIEVNILITKKINNNTGYIKYQVKKGYGANIKELYAEFYDITDTTSKVIRQSLQIKDSTLFVDSALISNLINKHDYRVDIKIITAKNEYLLSASCVMKVE